MFVKLQWWEIDKLIRWTAPVIHTADLAVSQTKSIDFPSTETSSQIRIRTETVYYKKSVFSSLPDTRT